MTGVVGVTLPPGNVTFTSVPSAEKARWIVTLWPGDALDNDLCSTEPAAAQMLHDVEVRHNLLCKTVHVYNQGNLMSAEINLFESGTLLLLELNIKIKLALSQWDKKRSLI